MRQNMPCFAHLIPDMWLIGISSVHVLLTAGTGDAVMVIPLHTLAGLADGRDSSSLAPAQVRCSRTKDFDSWHNDRSASLPDRRLSPAMAAWGTPCCVVYSCIPYVLPADCKEP
jgi:hypothetical protein